MSGLCSRKCVSFFIAEGLCVSPIFIRVLFWLKVRSVVLVKAKGCDIWKDTIFETKQNSFIKDLIIV